MKLEPNLLPLKTKWPLPNKNKINPPNKQTLIKNVTPHTQNANTTNENQILLTMRLEEPLFLGAGATAGAIPGEGNGTTGAKGAGAGVGDGGFGTLMSTFWPVWQWSETPQMK